MIPFQATDPLGTAILDFWNGSHDAEILVFSDQADPDVIPVAYLFRSEEEMPEREKEALALCKGTVLDIGAGAGSHSLALLQKGADVTALEISEKACSVIKARGVSQVRCGDFYSLAPTQFDTLLLLMNGTGLAGTLENLPRFLETCKKWLAPGGQILLESSDILYLYEEEDGSYLVDLNGPYYGELTYKMEYKLEKSDPFPWLFIDSGLLHQFAEEAGLEATLLWEEEDGHYLARLYVR